MGKLAYRSVGLAVSLFLVTVTLYNSQLYFKTSPQPLDVPVEVHENPKASGPGVPEDFVADGAANAVMLMLARNRELEGAVASVKNLEERFNQRYHYPWVFLNEEPFTEEFKQRVSAVTNSTVSFGQIPREDWFQPDWVDEAKAKAGRDALVRQNIVYGGSVSYVMPHFYQKSEAINHNIRYRNMCRFQSRAFYRQELVLPYRWYWRVEPHVSFYCDMDFDPFAYLHNNKKVYGFNLAVYEFMETIPTLWSTVQEFVKRHPQYLAPNNSMEFLSDDGGTKYNGCHYWSNMEIADMEFWRGEAYSAYVDYLESTGGFFYERWGDAPVHSMAVSLFLPSDKIHFFDKIGYTHEPHSHCPQDLEYRAGHCNCPPGKSIDWRDYSCYPKWFNLNLRMQRASHGMAATSH